MKRKYRVRIEAGYIASNVARYIVLGICQHSNTYAAISSFNPKAR